MQITKEKVEKRILTAARQEFLKYGFSGSSLRKIAKKAKITTSNIYNYFKNKDEIFIKILSPTIHEILFSITIEQNIQYLEMIKQWDLITIYEKVEFINKYVDSHREELELLLFKSFGSSLENFREEFIDKYTNLFIIDLKLLKEKFPLINADLSYYAVRRLASFFVNVISDIIRYNLSYDEIQKFMKEIVVFFYYGFFVELLKLKNSE
jgi:TetR/AcrR family transcriptional regulator, cholesterol catabolism regulator